MLLIHYFFSFLLICIPNCVFTVWVNLVCRNIWISYAALLLDWWGTLHYLFFNKWSFYWGCFYNFWLQNSLLFYQRFCLDFFLLYYFFYWFWQNFFLLYNFFNRFFLNSLFHWSRFFNYDFFFRSRFFSNNFFLNWFFLYNLFLCWL